MNCQGKKEYSISVNEQSYIKGRNPNGWTVNVKGIYIYKRNSSPFVSCQSKTGLLEKYYVILFLQQVFQNDYTH